MTARAKPVFVVKESADGVPWIAIEYAQSAAGIPSGLGFDLPSGTSLAEAHAIARYLQEKLTVLSYT